MKRYGVGGPALAMLSAVNTPGNYSWIKGGPAGGLVSLKAPATPPAAGWQRDGARHVQGRETPSPDRLRPERVSEQLNCAGNARYGGRDDRARGDDSCFVGPRRGGRVGNEQATDEPASNNGPAPAAGVHTVTRLIYRISCRTLPAGGANTGTLPHRVISIAGFPRADCTCDLAN